MEARNELLEWRYQDLQEQVEVLAARRDELLSHSHRDLEEAKDAVRATRSRDALRQLQDGVIVLPDTDEATGEATSDGSGSDNVTRFPA